MTILTGNILAILMIGTTHYVDVGGSTDAVIYYPSETVAHMSLPDGPTWKGVLELKDEGYFVTWDGGPAGDWQIAHEPGRFVYIGPDGEEAGFVTKIVPGNVEDF